jgi:hypothetical protein
MARPTTRGLGPTRTGIADARLAEVQVEILDSLRDVDAVGVPFGGRNGLLVEG